MAEEGSHSTFSGEEGHSTILLAHTKIFTRLISILMHSLYLHKKCMEILLLLCNLDILASDQIKEETNKKIFCFFEQLFSNFRYKKQLLTFFLETFLGNYGKRFGKYRSTCVKP